MFLLKLAKKNLPALHVQHDEPIRCLLLRNHVIPENEHIYVRSNLIKIKSQLSEISYGLTFDKKILCSTKERTSLYSSNTFHTHNTQHCSLIMQNEI